MAFDGAISDADGIRIGTHRWHVETWRARQHPFPAHLRMALPQHLNSSSKFWRVPIDSRLCPDDRA